MNSLKQYSFYTILLPLLLCCGIVTAQVHPANGDSVHYRLTGFEVPAHLTATQYILHIGTDKELKKPLQSITSTTQRIIATLPWYDTTYYWRVEYKKKRKTVGYTDVYRLTTLPNPWGDTVFFNMEILQPPKAHKDMLIFLGSTRSLYSLSGEHLWFLPAIKGITDNRYPIRDLKLTNRNTITFLSDLFACEIDYDGNLLWQAPNNGKISGEKTELIHHEFTRLENGHYMIAGNKPVKRQLPDNVSDLFRYDRSVTTENGKYYTMLEAGTLIEYDTAGNIVWTWICADHLADEDIFTPMKDSTLFTGTHLNGFYFDQKNNIIYASFRDISRVMKISYPSGEVLAHYGSNYPHGQRIKGDGLFYGQHAARLDSNGHLYLFNNNAINREAYDSTRPTASTIVVMKEPENNTDDPAKLWEFSCDIDTMAKAYGHRGGIAYELNNGDFLVCMGDAARLFIVSREKKLLWNAIMHLMFTNKIFAPPPYRVSPVEDVRGMLYRQ